MDENGAVGDTHGLDIAARHVADALRQVSDREQELKGQMQLVAEERKRLTVALRALEPEHSLVAMAKSKRKSKSASPEALLRTWEWVKGLERAFTIREAADAMGYKSDDPVRRAIYQLRDIEALRAAGKIKIGKGYPAMQFRVMDREAGDSLVMDNG